MKNISSLRFISLAASAFLLGMVLTLGFSAQAADLPGTINDPLVTQDWVQDYVDRQFASLELRLENLAKNSGPNLVLYIGSNQALVNGNTVIVPAPPQLMGAGYTMVPARFIGESLGLQVDWDAANRKVTFSGQGREITLTIDKTTASINGQPYAMPYAPVIWNGHTLVHARFVSEAFQCKVDWEAAAKRVTITR